MQLEMGTKVKVAKLAAFAALALAAAGALLGMGSGDIVLLASAVPCLFVAALFWSLHEIGEKLGLASLVAAGADVATGIAREKDLNSPDVANPNETIGADLQALEQKLAAKRK